MLALIDLATQYGEDNDVQIPRDVDDDDVKGDEEHAVNDVER